MQAQIDEREEKPVHSMPVASALTQLIEALRQQIAREAQRKAVE